MHRMAFSSVAWGYGQYGAHGLGITSDVDANSPGEIKLPALNGQAPKHIAAGPVHGILVTSNHQYPLLYLCFVVHSLDTKTKTHSQTRTRHMFGDTAAVDSIDSSSLFQSAWNS